MAQRHSLLRDAIMSLLVTHHLLTAPELLIQLHKVGRKVNKTSMYRALDLLQAQHKICRHNFEQNDLRYEVTTDHHDHLYCSSCGSVNSIECALNITTELNGFKVDHHHVTIFGLCEKCS